MNDFLIDSGVTDPIVNLDGIPSDHGTVFCSFRMPRVPQHKKEDYSYHHLTNAGDIKFAAWLDEMERDDWAEINEAQSSSEMVESLHELFLKAMNQ